MNTKGQTKLEYLMLYGWATIVIVIVVGVLVFMTTSPPQETSRWQEEWQCMEWKESTCKSLESWGHWAESPYSGELEFYCCNQPKNIEYVPNCYLTNKEKTCVQQTKTRCLITRHQECSTWTSLCKYIETRECENKEANQ